jgi:hypothetical protein
MVTPVANMPSVARKSRGEKSGGWAAWPAARDGDMAAIYMKIHQ